MKKYFDRAFFRRNAPLWVCLVLIVILLLLPTGFEGALQYPQSQTAVARVLSTDDSAIIDTGLVRSGEQLCHLQILGGSFKDQKATGVNLLRGSLEQDKLFAPGDKAQVVISHQDGCITNVTMVDHYRLPWEYVLAGCFVLLLILFAGKTGIRALFSFVLTLLALWKLLVPLYLKGYDPIWIGLGICALLTLMIIALVYGFDRRCAAACAGSVLGLLFTCLLGILFTNAFRLHGAVMPYAESLLYAGYPSLDLTGIFMASIFLGSSGAVMDLAVGITSSVWEVRQKKPDIRPWEAVRSGMNVGRASLGTMTTTLLLAYSGGFVSLLMVFMAQGTPVSHIFNYKYVAAELVHTIVGSFGLVTVAPFTALCSGLLLAAPKRNAS